MAEEHLTHTLVREALHRLHLVALQSALDTALRLVVCLGLSEHCIVGIARLRRLLKERRMHARHLILGQPKRQRGFPSVQLVRGRSAARAATVGAQVPAQDGAHVPARAPPFRCVGGSGGDTRRAIGGSIGGRRLELGLTSRRSPAAQLAQIPSALVAALGRLREEAPMRPEQRIGKERRGGRSELRVHLEKPEWSCFTRGGMGRSGE